jgi:hypothetical protein
MLQLHGLQDPDTTMQLSLFSSDVPPLPDRAERLHQAYHLQGERIAYVEK